MSCGDENWTWFRHYFSLCSKCGSLVETETKECSHCNSKKYDDEDYYLDFHDENDIY